MELSNQQIRAQMEDAESLPMLLLEANEYLQLFCQEQSLPESYIQKRLAEITFDYRKSRTYWQTAQELAYGAKVAWRNSTRCILHSSCGTGSEKQRRDGSCLRIGGELRRR